MNSSTDGSTGKRLEGPIPALPVCKGSLTLTHVSSLRFAFLGRMELGIGGIASSSDSFASPSPRPARVSVTYFQLKCYNQPFGHRLRGRCSKTSRTVYLHPGRNSRVQLFPRIGFIYAPTCSGSLHCSHPRLPKTRVATESRSLVVPKIGRFMTVCLVTGGAGLIGSPLVEALVARHDRVRVLDDFSGGSWAYLEDVRSEIDLLTGNVTDRQTVRAAVEGVDVVFHLACATAAAEAGADPLAIHHSIATGTLHVLEAARDAQVGRVVYAGTGVVYRDDDDQPRCETDPTMPRSLYASAKLAAEHYCLNFSRQHGLETVCLRYF